jgi:oligopeptide transport system substrate-binding protein
MLKIFKLLKKRQQRFPKVYERDLLFEIGMHTLVEIKKSSFLRQDLKKLTRLICLQYHLRHKLQEIKAEQYALSVKLSWLKAGGNDAFGISIGVNLESSYDVLEEKHIARAVANLLPGVRVIPESFYCCRERDRSFLFCYLEIERLRGNNFTSHDWNLLRFKLPSELKRNIQSLTFSLLFSSNDEEVYKSAVRLAEELKSENDLPQVIILFQSQIQEGLLFKVILVHVRKKNALPFSSERHPLPSSCHMTLEKVLSLTTFPKGDIKEAILFSLEVECGLFLGKNWSIDLDRARNYVAKLVEQMFGHFRDYNGGLLIQQSKQLEQIKKHLRRKYENCHLLVEDVFHSFRPMSFQALLNLSTARRLFAFVNARLKECKGKIEKKIEGNSLFALMRIPTSFSQNALLKELRNMQKEMHSAAYSCFEYEREYYLCFVELDVSLGSNILTKLEHILQTISENKERHSILKLNFQEGDPPSLNPQIAIDQRCRCIEMALFEGLTRLNIDGKPELAAAKEVHRSASDTVYTFVLRKLHWSNGEEVTAFDFEQSWKKAIAPQSHCLRSDLFFIIKNAKKAHLGEKPLDEVKIKAVNTKTLVVELEYPAFYFLDLVANPVFSPIYREEQEPYHFNGPFLLKQWKRDHCLHLTSNPYYWDKKNVQLKDIIISMFKEVNLFCKQFENGELDWFGEPFTTSSVRPHRQQASWHQKNVSQVYWIYLNTRTSPLFSVPIRKALACAINREQITQKFEGRPCTLNTISNLSYRRISCWDGNASLAQEFFQEGIEELKIHQNQFPPITLYWSADGERELVGVIQEQIQSVLGIKIRLKNIKWQALSYLLDKREYQMASCYRSTSPLYPRSYLELFRDCSNLYNSSQWENISFRACLDRALKYFQTEERDKWLLKAEEILMDEMPIIPIFFPNYNYLLNGKIERAAIAPNGDVDFKWISISQN